LEKSRARNQDSADIVRSFVISSARFMPCFL
jgi:hypothetical protein